MDNLEAWPKLLFEFGPYAILVLFILLVIPRTSKRLQNMKDTAPKAVRISGITVLFISWGVVLLMVGYILLKWSPLLVYQGKLGILKYSESIYPLDDNIYVKAEGVHGRDLERWHFVLVDEDRKIKKKKTAAFTYFWGESDNEYTDYRIPMTFIVAGEFTDFTFNRKDAEEVYLWDGNGWVPERGSTGHSRGSDFDLVEKAYADEGVNLERLADELASTNRLVRAKARNKLRGLSDAELEALEARTRDQNALHQIRLERQRREH